MTEPVLAGRDLPFLNFADPSVATDPFGAVRAAARHSWIARIPNGYLILRHEECLTWRGTDASALQQTSG